MNDLSLFDPYKALEEIRRNAAREGAKSLPQELPQKLPQAPAEVIPVIDHGLKHTSATSAGVPRSDTCSHAPAYKKIEKIFNYFNHLRVRVGGQGVGVKCPAPGGLRKLRNLRKFR